MDRTDDEPGGIRSPESVGAGAPGRPGIDHAVAALAARQHGVVTRAQLLAYGLSRAAVSRRVDGGRLHRLHPGVYAVGHARLAQRGWWMAAVLSGGPGALLSHRSAAAIWGLVDGAPASTDVLMLRSGTARPGIRARRTRAVADVDRAVIDGIPVTSVARTVVDVAPLVGGRRVDRALRRAEELRVLDVSALEAVLRRARPGTTVVRAALEAVARDARDDVRTKKELELRFHELLRSQGFEAPRTNVSVWTPWESYEVDALWPDSRLVIELDGWQTHRDRESFRRDHRRDADLVAGGYRVVRLTWEQVVHDPAATVARLALVIPPGT